MALPESARAALVVASTLNIFMTLIFIVTVIVFAMLYLGPYRNPGWITPGFALLLFSFGLAAIGTGEFVREAVRKPYIIYDVVQSNQVLPGEVASQRENGYLEGGVWTSAYIAQNYPQVVDESGQIDETALLELPGADRLEVGRVLYMYHCNDCHALEDGYTPVAQLTRGWTHDMVSLLVERPERAHFFMPPWGGTPEEAELLTDYLLSVSKPFPTGLSTTAMEE
jgi:mono/diheme cytochrome c family protein